MNKMSGLLRGTSEKTYEEQYTLSVADLCLPAELLRPNAVSPALS